MDTPWKALSKKDTDELHHAIEYVHHAAQLVAAVGNSLLPKADDDSQSNLEWLPGLNALAGQIVDGHFRIALRYLPFEILVLDDENRIHEGEGIPGRTKKELLTWLQRAVTRAGGKGARLKEIDHYEIPDHRVEHGKKFPDIDAAILHELIRFRADADWVLNEIAGLYRDATPVRTWPHHFDTGTLLILEKDEAGQPSETIGLGWAIPDEQFDQPYFYVNHWTNDPQADYSRLEELEGAGRWHHNGWHGAVLLSTDVIEHQQTDDQQQEVLFFFRSAIRALSTLKQEVEGSRKDSSI